MYKPFGKLVALYKAMYILFCASLDCLYDASVSCNVIILLFRRFLPFEVDLIGILLRRNCTLKSISHQMVEPHIVNTHSH